MRKSKINSEVVAKAFEYAKSGFNNKQIYEALGISKSTLYANSDLMDSIKKGQSELRSEVSSSLLKNAIKLDNPTVQIFLAKRLRLFDETFDTFSLKTSKDIVKAFSELFIAVGNGVISEEKARQLQCILESTMKAYEVNELEQRVEELEKSS